MIVQCQMLSTAKELKACIEESALRLFDPMVLGRPENDRIKRCLQSATTCVEALISALEELEGLEK